jgi:serine/threonine protein kinase
MTTIVKYGGVSEVTIDTINNRVMKKYMFEYASEGSAGCFTAETMIMNLLQEVQGFPHIIDIETDGYNHSIIMPYLGEPLRKPPDSLGTFVKILKLVNVLHNHNIVHADLKPDNILINEQGEVGIIDFSHSLLMYRNVLGKSMLYPSTILSHYEYMAPETYNKTPIRNEKLDVWSLGCILYEMVTGVSLFSGFGCVGNQEKKGQNCDKIMGYKDRIIDHHAHMEEIFEKIDAITEHETEKTLIHLMLQHSPELRPSTAEILKLLGQVTTVPLLYDMIPSPQSEYSVENDCGGKLYKCLLHHMDAHMDISLMVELMYGYAFWGEVLGDDDCDADEYVKNMSNILKNHHLSVMYTH